MFSLSAVLCQPNVTPELLSGLAPQSDPDQQHWHHLGTYYKCRISSPTPDQLNQSALKQDSQVIPIPAKV